MDLIFSFFLSFYLLSTHSKSTTFSCNSFFEFYFFIN
nr:MAG TPA: hypothetical protein [Bacteriophage sp.]